MTAAKGFFSIVQFCPDLDRCECVNTGVILAVPERNFFEVKMAEDNEGPKQRFGKDAFDDARLNVAKRAMEGRLRREGSDMLKPDDLLQFAKKEGNNLTLTLPRVIFVENAQSELDELFQRLVRVDPRHRRRQIAPDLRAIFEPALVGVPLMRDQDVSIPEIGISIHVPYAYRNGRLNLIKPEGFPLDAHSAAAKANDLAVKGHLIYKHKGESGESRQLIIVGGFDRSFPQEGKNRIEVVLREHDARLIPEENVAEFAEEIRRVAHV